MKTASKLIPYYDKEGYDALICDEKNRFFAIFDGMGVSPESRYASTYAKEYFEKNVTGFCDKEILRGHLQAIQHDISATRTVGTTAVVVSINDVGALNYAHAGDSRLYILNNGHIKQITTDEGFENMLDNYIGLGGTGISQFGSIEKWDKFLLCSDGITGDRKPDLLSDKQIEDCLNSDNDPKVLCEKIVAMSSKRDDKSVIVGVR